MFNPAIDLGNVIAISEEDLKEDQKQALEKAIEDYRQLCLKSFSLNRSGECNRTDQIIRAQVQKQAPKRSNFRT
jgi:predicted molibdopterin-dependent oxidoreductase YjgC